MESLAFGSKSVRTFYPQHISFKMKHGLKHRKLAVSPVLDQGYDLRVGLSDDALSIHFHYPIPCTESENQIHLCCLLLTAT